VSLRERLREIEALKPRHNIKVVGFGTVSGGATGIYNTDIPTGEVWQLHYLDFEVTKLEVFYFTIKIDGVEHYDDVKVSDSNLRVYFEKYEPVASTRITLEMRNADTVAQTHVTYLKYVYFESEKFRRYPR